MTTRYILMSNFGRDYFMMIDPTYETHEQALNSIKHFIKAYGDEALEWRFKIEKIYVF